MSRYYAPATPYSEAMKHPWRGHVLAVQPRIRLSRSFDQRSHTYLGYVLRIEGMISGLARMFLVAIGKAAQTKHEFRAGDQVSGESGPVTPPSITRRAS